MPKLASAIWCRRLGLVSLAALLASVAAHRLSLIEARTMVTTIMLAFVAGAAAVLLGSRALIWIWRVGYRGGGAVLIGFLTALATLAPAVLAGYFAFSLPSINDVSTDLEFPPELALSAAGELAGSGRSFTPILPDPTSQAAGYPDIVSGIYSDSTVTIYRSAVIAAEGLGWTVAEEFPPAGVGEPGRFFATDRTLVFGFVDDVTVRILPTGAGARVDIRSRSRIGRHDLGANARRIRDFLAALNDAIFAATRPQ